VSFRRLAKGNKKAPGQAGEFVKVRSKGSGHGGGLLRQGNQPSKSGGVKFRLVGLHIASRDKTLRRTLERKIWSAPAERRGNGALHTKKTARVYGPSW